MKTDMVKRFDGTTIHKAKSILKSKTSRKIALVILVVFLVSAKPGWFTF